MADYILTHSGAQVDSAVGRAIAGGQIDTNLTAHTSNTTVHVTAENKTAWNAKSSKATSFTKTLLSASWTDNSQTITFTSGQLPITGYAYIVSPASADIENYVTAKIIAEDVTVADQMAFTCTTTPTEDIDVIILKTEVQ